MRIIDQEQVRAKLGGSIPRILADNRSMVTQTLNAVKAELIPETPLGPGHFGLHLRDSYTVDVSGEGMQTIGALKAPPQGYWREFGTRGGYRSSNRTLRAFTNVLLHQGGSFASGGEKAGLYAAHALAKFRRLVNFYYGHAQWWRL